MRKLLRHRNARRYLIGQCFSLFADTAMFLAMGMVHVPFLNVRELTLSSRTLFESAFYQDEQWQPVPNMDHRDEVHTCPELGKP
jgi:hypothetical protein